MVKIITINSLLKKLETLNVKLIAGEQGIDKVIDYINIQEFALKSDRIKKNGVLMTTFAAFPDSEKIIEHLQWLLSKEIHAVGIHSVFIKKIPDEVISFSNENNLPIFLIPVEVSYQQIMQVYFDLLVDDMNIKRLNLEQINIKMLKSIALEQGAQYIISIMGKYLKVPIIHVDNLLNIKSFWAEGKVERKEIQHIVDKLTSTDKEISIEKGIFKYNESSGYPIINSFKFLPLMDNKNFYGYLILKINKELSALDKSVINYGKTALLLDAIKNSTLEKYLRNEDMKIIESLLETTNKKAGNYYNLSRFVKDLNVVYLIEFTNPSNLQETFEYIYQIINKSLQNSLIWVFNEQIICITEDRIPSKVINQISNSFDDIFIGISDMFDNTSSDSIREKYEQAQFGLKVGKCKYQKVSRWTTLGYDKYLFAIQQNAVLKESALTFLKPLIEHDKKYNSELIRTLNVYLANFFSLKRCADKLFIHKNTVKYRINKIKEIYSDLNLEDPESYLLFLSSLKIYSLLEKDNFS